MTDARKPTLRDIALAASQKVGGLQGRALDREAKRHGLRLSYTTVDRIIAGTYNSRPKADTLEALSALAGVPLEQVYEAARLPMPAAHLADQLPPEADLLTEAQRRVVIDVIRVFARQNRELDQARLVAEELMGNAQHPAPTSEGADAPHVEVTAEWMPPETEPAQGSTPQPPPAEPGSSPS